MSHARLAGKFDKMGLHEIMTDKIGLIGERINSLLKERGIIARCELLHRIYQAVREADLSDAEMDILRRMVGDRPAPGIFSSMMSGHPVFPDTPKLDSFIVIHGRIFHFPLSGKYDRPDFERAYETFKRLRGELLELVRFNLEDLTTDFLIRAGYSQSHRGLGRLSFVKGDDRLEVLVYPRISMLDVEECILASELYDSMAAIVPHEENLDPFMAFYREHVSHLEDTDVQIWVANMEEGTIDPFMGFTTDPEIYMAFKNPKLASLVRSRWRFIR